MASSELRRAIYRSVDDIESRVNDILHDLQVVANKAEWDTEVLSLDDIGDLQLAIQHAVEALTELASDLY